MQRIFARTHGARPRSPRSLLATVVVAGGAAAQDGPVTADGSAARRHRHRGAERAGPAHRLVAIGRGGCQWVKYTAAPGG